MAQAFVDTVRRGETVSAHTVRAIHIVAAQFAPTRYVPVTNAVPPRTPPSPRPLR